MHPFSKTATMLMNLSCWPCVRGMYVAPDFGKIAERGNMAGAFKLDDASQSLYPLLLLFRTRGTENERHAPVDDPKNTSFISHHLPLAAASLPIMRGREGACETRWGVNLKMPVKCCTCNIPSWSLKWQSPGRLEGDSGGRSACLQPGE